MLLAVSMGKCRLSVAAFLTNRCPNCKSTFADVASARRRSRTPARVAEEARKLVETARTGSRPRRQTRRGGDDSLLTVLTC